MIEQQIVDSFLLYKILGKMCEDTKRHYTFNEISDYVTSVEVKDGFPDSSLLDTIAKAINQGLMEFDGVLYSVTDKAVQTVAIRQKIIAEMCDYLDKIS